MISAQIFLQAFCLLSVCKLSWAADPEIERMIDNYIENTYLPGSTIPGFAIAVVQNGELVFSKGYGYRDLENNLKVDNKTLFGVGSVTKSITATLALKVLSEKFPELGPFVLDTPIVKLAPSYNFSFSDRYRAENIAFRDLLAHKACLLDSSLSLNFNVLKSSEEFSYRLRYAPEICPFRSGQFEYSNSLYGFVGEIIAHIAGTTFENLMITFLKDIGMVDVSLFQSNGEHESFPNLAKGYYPLNGKNEIFNMTLTRRVGVAKGMGAVIATVTDMGQFMKLHLNEGRVGNRTIIRPEILSLMYQISSTPNPFGLNKQNELQPLTGVYGYGFGMAIGVNDGWTWLQHGGFFPPYANQISIFPSNNISIFTTNNQVSADLSLYYDRLVHTVVFEIFKGFETGNLSESFKNYDFGKNNMNLQRDSIDEHWSRLVTKNSIKKVNKGHQIQQSNLVGSYGSALDGELEIAQREVNGSLSIIYGDWGIGVLLPVEINLYKIEWETDINQAFYGEGSVPPQFYADFSDSDTLNLAMDETEGIVIPSILSTFVRNANLNSFPEIPWDSNSCGPSYVK